MPQIPAKKVGTPFQRPDWRVRSIEDPEQYGISDLLTPKQETRPAASCYRRLSDPLKNNTKAEFQYPEFLEDVCKGLPPELALKLKQVYRGKWKARNSSKIVIDRQNYFSWNRPAISKLKDAALRRFIEHQAIIRFDSDVAWACNFRTDEHNSENATTMGRAIFAGLADETIAKMWNASVGEVEMYRLLFYDFSAFPKDRAARFAMLRQMVAIDLLDEADFEQYKMIFDLGPLTFRIETDLSNLTTEELAKVDHYIKSSYVANVLNLGKAIKVKRDALDYHNAVTTYARMSQQGEYLNQMRARTQYFDIMTQKARKDLGTGTANLQEEDKAMLELIRAGQFVNYDFKPKSLSDISIEVLSTSEQK